MNNCTFTGYLAEEPILDQMDGVSYLDLKIVVYNYRKTKGTGEKSKTPVYIYCEAWHTGAETIASLAREGDKITIHATAKNVRNPDGDGFEEELVIFRINEFDLPCINWEDDRNLD